jgi:hypothetical protein
MTLDTGKHEMRLGCVTQCAAAQMAYIIDAMLNDSVAWQYQMLNVKALYAYNSGTYYDGDINIYFNP